MRYLKIIFTTISMGLLLCACDPCGHLECKSDDVYGQFRIVSAADGRDLVFGPNRVYDKTQIKFYYLKGMDTTFLDYQTIRFPNTGYDSILYVRLYPWPDTAFMRLSNGDVDTLQISYRTTSGTRCCKGVKEITKFRFNNTVDIPGGAGTQEIKK